MRFEIVLAPDALRALRSLAARSRTQVHESLQVHLRYEPMKTSRSRIKRLRELSHPQYRLRVGDIRVFYDVVGAEVHVLAIVTKQEAEEWLRREGVHE